MLDNIIKKYVEYVDLNVHPALQEQVTCYPAKPVERQEQISSEIIIEKPSSSTLVWSYTNQRTTESEIKPWCCEHKSIIGDMHANSMKLMFFIIKQGIVELDNDTYQNDSNENLDAYTMLLHIYYKDPYQLTARDKIIFDTIINKMSVTEGAYLLLLGDELADRGTNDYFILKILDKLIEKNVNLEIMLSNHTMEFIIRLEQKIAQANGTPFNLPDNLLVTDLYNIESNDQAASYKGLLASLHNGVVTEQETLAFYEKFKTKLQLISHFMLPSSEEIMLKSHSSVSETTVLMLAIALLKQGSLEPFQSEYPELHMKIIKAGDQIERAFKNPVLACDENIDLLMITIAQMLSDIYVEPKELISLIDSINIKLSEHLNHYTGYKVLDLSIISDDSSLDQLTFSHKLNNFLKPFRYTMWNREEPFDDIHLNIHGHHSKDFDNRINLDNTLGKHRTRMTGTLSYVVEPIKPSLVPIPRIRP